MNCTDLCIPCLLRADDLLCCDLAYQIREKNIHRHLGLSAILFRLFCVVAQRFAQSMPEEAGKVERPTFRRVDKRMWYMSSEGTSPRDDRSLSPAAQQLIAKTITFSARPPFVWATIRLFRSRESLYHSVIAYKTGLTSVITIWRSLRKYA